MTEVAEHPATADIAYTPVTLPSRGVLYLHPETGEPLLPDGRIHIRRLGVAEDATIFGSGGNVVDKLSKVIRTCCKLPHAALPGGTTFDHSDLLLTDRMYLLVALRTLSFGPNYDFSFRCTQCGAQNRKNVDIVEELVESPGGALVDHDDPTGAREALVEPIVITLPDAKCEVSLKFLRGSDESRLIQQVKRLKMQTSDAADPSQRYRYALMLVEKDGKPVPNMMDRQDIVSTWSALDAAKVRTAMTDAESGIDLTVYPDCTQCGSTVGLEMPFDAEFFRPSVR